MRLILSIIWFIGILASPFIHYVYVSALPDYEKGISFMLSIAYFISGIGLLFYWGTHSKLKEGR